MVITFHSNVKLRRIIYRDVPNSTRKPSANSNGHKFLLRCMCEADDISRYWKMNNGSSQEIQMVITFNSDVQLSCIIYRNARNWTQKLSANLNGHNFWLGCMLEAHDISRRLKMNNGSSQEIQIVITFITDVQFRCIIHRDARNWTRKLSAYSDNHNFWLGCMIEAHDISTRSKLNSRSSREIQMVITFHSDVRFRRIIYPDARNWTMEALEQFKWSWLFTRISDSGT